MLLIPVEQPDPEDPHINKRHDKDRHIKTNAKREKQAKQKIHIALDGDHRLQKIGLQPDQEFKREWDHNIKTKKYSA